MSTKYYKTKEFIKLQNEWYDKISLQGFSDLEWLDKKTGSGHSAPFLRTSLNKFKSLSASEVLTKLEYFSAAKSFSTDFKFSSRLLKFIWLLHCDGVSYRKMIPMISARGFKHIPSIFWISTHLKKLRHHFQLWQLEQPEEHVSTQQFMQDNTPAY